MKSTAMNNAAIIKTGGHRPIFTFKKSLVIMTRSLE
jgi:hypothetical protein